MPRICAVRCGPDPPFQQGAHVPEPSLSSPPAAGVTKALSALVIALMLGAIIYATWIAIRNWSHIGV
jgi:hypothetical protein